MADTIYAWEFEREGQAVNVWVSGPLTFNEPELMLDAALDGLGVGYLLDNEVAPYVDQGRLLRRLAEWTPPFAGFHLYHSSRRQMRPVLAAFIEALRGRKWPTEELADDRCGRRNDTAPARLRTSTECRTLVADPGRSRGRR